MLLEKTYFSLELFFENRLIEEEKFYVTDMLGNSRLFVPHSEDEDKMICYTSGEIVTVVEGLYCLTSKEGNELYYLHTRCYYAAHRRFISSDGFDYLNPSSLDECNLYVYCKNDPVNLCDPSRHFSISALLIGAFVGGIIRAI